MNWTETRTRLMELLPGREFPEGWLTDADLTDADLTDADLYGADLYGCVDIAGFTLGRHFGFYQLSSGYCKIGCLGLPIAEWLARYEGIGRENKYTEAEIARYGAMLRLLAEWR